MAPSDLPIWAATCATGRSAKKCSITATRRRSGSCWTAERTGRSRARSGSWATRELVSDDLAVGDLLAAPLAPVVADDIGRGGVEPGSRLGHRPSGSAGGQRPGGDIVGQIAVADQARCPAGQLPVVGLIDPRTAYSSASTTDPMTGTDALPDAWRGAAIAVRDPYDAGMCAPWLGHSYKRSHARPVAQRAEWPGHATYRR